MKLLFFALIMCLFGCTTPRELKNRAVHVSSVKTFRNHLENQKWQLYSIKEYHGISNPDSASHPVSVRSDCGSIYTFHSDSTIYVDYKGTCLYKELRGYRWHIGQEENFLYLVLRKVPIYQAVYRLYKSNGDTMILYTPGLSFHSGIKVLSVYEWHHVKE